MFAAVIAAVMCCGGASAVGGTGSALPGAQRTCLHSHAYVFAHEDDPLLFMMPAIANDIASGDCVHLIELTAGDAGLGSAYWKGREQGLRVALAFISKKADGWREADAGIPGHPTQLWTLKTDPRVSVIFLNLPDGQSEGVGFPADGNQSLSKLWWGNIPTMTSVDGTAMYTRSQLIQTIGMLIRRAGADTVGSQDYDAPFTIVPNHDHYDHIAGALFTDEAVELYARLVTLIRYQDYSIIDLPSNLTSAQIAEKQRAFLAYAHFDPPVAAACDTPASCVVAGFGLELSRQAAAFEPKPYPAG